MHFKTIVVGLDGSTHSNKALERAVASAKVHKARLLLVGVIPFPDDALDRVLHWRTRGRFSRALEAGVAFAKKHKVKAVPMLLDGRPSEELLWIAKRSRADLLIIGCWGNTFRARAARMFMGGVSKEIVEKAPCSVLIVR